MPLLDVTLTSPNDWKYISEGGATIVFSYCGPPDERFDERVLRLKKQTIDVGGLEGDETFQTEIIPRLVPRKHLVEMEAVTLSTSWLEALSALSTSLRPTWRTDYIDCASPSGFLAPNLTSSLITVEIKPKWSFLGPGMHTCRFCMHSSIRGWTTSYCPLDLFSQNPTRMKDALYHLYNSQTEGTATQNNFRIFIQGERAAPAQVTSTLQRLGMLQPEAMSQDRETRELVVETLHASLVQPESLSLLQTLNRLQRTLDDGGIENLASLWDQVHLKQKPFGEGNVQPSLDEWSSFVKEYLKLQDTPASSEVEAVEARLRYHILSYLLSTTFKDCSIMIMLDSLQHKSSTTPSRIFLIDLDPKPIERLSKWLKQDRNIANEYAALASQSKKECVDDWSSEK
ncbi:inositol-pentakisphosphate 2-kinase [Lentinula raphanica]|uniref:Inositol-pentakisphosphate 2-kinase n=1 Tax=Lentinula raphanica TaxID=153919 RepID=A0AA38UF00_9AGAR|nr:inositol-pentakisphosphate 2-kinase [Lentinula raphanica]KAJ3835667.1 inositol-pentakisphosphate 2-kinase [Lentinula raphanica]KAJ3977073.1 inositol-pentakisphosphate 2-kinase [Lentinula raphanica]